jgi:hypothetical protein
VEFAHEADGTSLDALVAAAAIRQPATARLAVN